MCSLGRITKVQDHTLPKKHLDEEDGFCCLPCSLRWPCCCLMFGDDVIIEKLCFYFLCIFKVFPVHRLVFPQSKNRETGLFFWFFETGSLLCRSGCPWTHRDLPLLSKLWDENSVCPDTWPKRVLLILGGKKKKEGSSSTQWISVCRQTENSPSLEWVNPLTGKDWWLCQQFLVPATLLSIVNVCITWLPEFPFEDL